MKVFTNKKIIQKMTIVLVFLMLFNFIVPSYSRGAVTIDDIGEALVTGINYLLLKVGDGIIYVLQKIFIGTDAFDSHSVNTLPTIALSPGKIFSGVIYALDINFLSPESGESDINGNLVSDAASDEDFTAIFDEIMIKLDSEASNGNVYDIIKSGIENLMLEEIGNQSSLKFLEYCWSEWGLTTDSELNADEISTLIYMRSDYFNDVSTNQEHTQKENEVQRTLEEIGLVDLIVSFGTYKDNNESILTQASKASNSPANILHDVIATWYKIMRNIALVLLLSILVYVGIRIMLSSTAADNTKYKKMLIDWVVAICILLALHYIMAFAINITQLISGAFSGGDTATSQDKIMNAVRGYAESNIASDWGIAYSLLYIVLIVYTIYYIFYYVKRVVYIAFLTLIAPLVALTYPMDKMGDSKSQAFDMWLREYILNIVIQPVHLLIYTVMVTSSLSLAIVNPIYAIVVIGAMIPAEKFIKEMFGLQSQKGPKGGFLAGATAMGLMQKAANRKPPKFGHHSGEPGKESSGKKEEIKKPRTVNNQNRISMASSYMPSKDEQDKTESKDIMPPTDSSITKAGSEDPLIDNNIDAPTDIHTTPDKEETAEQTPSQQFEANFKSINEDTNSEGTNDKDADTANGETDANGIPSASKHENNNESERITEVEAPVKTNDTEKNNIPEEGKKIKSAEISVPESSSPKKKNIKGRAALATAGHYARKVVNGKNIRKMARGVLRTGLGIVGAGTAATIGLAAGIATGDISNAAKLAGLGATAGFGLGKNVGDGISNFAGGTYDGITDIKNTYKDNYREFSKYDENAQKDIKHKDNQKYATSIDTMAAINNRFGMVSPKKMSEIQNAIIRYKDEDIDDLDIIFNSYNLEKGIDAKGNKIEGGPISQGKAMYAAKIASRGYDPDNESSRKSALNTAQFDFAQIYKAQQKAKNIEVSDSDAADYGKKIARNDLMPYLDMAKGKTYKEAQELKEQAAIAKAYDDAKEEKQMRQAAKFNAEAQNGSRQNS